MYPMPMNVAQQFVTDRRSSFEATATRHRLHRIGSRRSARALANEAVGTTVREAPMTIPALQGARDAASVCTLA